MPVDDEDLPYIGNRSDALAALDQLTDDLDRIRRVIEHIKDTIEREII
jgi:hypothetical protein